MVSLIQSWSSRRCCPGSFLPIALRGQQQSGRQYKPYLESLFPTSDHSGRSGHHQSRGPPDFSRAAGALMIWFRFMPDWRLLTLPLFTLMAFLAALGPGLFLTALNVKYRDFRYVMPFIVQFGLFISPVGFSSDVIPSNWRLVYSLNPIVGVIDGFRWAICRGASPIYLPGFALSMLVIAFFLILGIWYFRKTEKTFADVI